MIEMTEYGVLIPFEKWDEIQEKLSTTSSSNEVKILKKENASLRKVLNHMNSFLKGESNVQLHPK